MSFYLQGQWQFQTCSISNVTATNVTMSLNSQSGTVQFAKFVSDVDIYITFDKTVTATNSLRVPANNIIEFEPLLTDKVSFLGVSTTGNAYISYFINKQINLPPN